MRNHANGATDTTPAMAVYVAAVNDRNGNPRRGWLIVNATGDALAFADEGYSGRGALHALVGYVPETGRINITPSQYRALNREYGHGGRFSIFTREGE